MFIKVYIKIIPVEFSHSTTYSFDLHSISSTHLEFWFQLVLSIVKSYNKILTFVYNVNSYVIKLNF
jgi:hypothetical protein